MSPNLRKISDRNMDLMERKSRDYSRDNIQATGVTGIAARLMDKVSRLVNLTNSGAEPNFESIGDTLQDIANYGIIGQALTEGEWSRSTNLVYLAGPIDGIDPAISSNWRTYVGDCLAEHGVTSFNPRGAFIVGEKAPGDLIRAINRAAIDHSHIVLVNLTGPTMGFGTLREIEYAKATGKRVIVAQNRHLEENLDTYDLELVSTLEEAIFRIVGK